MKTTAYLLLLTPLLFLQCKTAQHAATTSTLENTYWKLTEVNGMPVITPENTREVHFILTKTENENQIKGFAGCNNLAGSYKTSGQSISFQVITTKMYCEDQMEVENFLTKTLSSTDSYKIIGNGLELYQGNIFLAKFEAVYLK